MPSADLYARAIIASAVSFGDDPIAALTNGRGSLRRSLAPAVAAIVSTCGVMQKSACQAVGLRSTVVSAARNANPVSFARAQAEAEAAIRYALRGKALAERQQAPPAPSVARAPPKTIAEVRQRQEARPKTRAMPRGATFQNIGGGVQVIRLKPIDDAILARARQQIAKGLSVADFADLFDVDAERLAAALEGQAA